MSLLNRIDEKSGKSTSRKHRSSLEVVSMKCDIPLI
jgi:hypothetical protein